MSVSDDYRTYALDQLGRVAPVTSRKMFGGVGVYSDGYFFALMDDDRLYLKVDDTNRPDFEAIGSGPFQPFPDKPGTMQYYELPGDRLEDVNELRGWVEDAIQVAKRAKAKKGKKK